jgi:hypothetical protein
MSIINNDGQTAQKEGDGESLYDRCDEKWEVMGKWSLHYLGCLAHSGVWITEDQLIVHDDASHRHQKLIIRNIGVLSHPSCSLNHALFNVYPIL